MSQFKEMDGHKRDGRKRAMETENDEPVAPKSKKEKFDKTMMGAQIVELNRKKRALTGGPKSFFEKDPIKSKQIMGSKSGTLGLIKPIRGILLDDPKGFENDVKKTYKRKTPAS